VKSLLFLFFLSETVPSLSGLVRSKAAAVGYGFGARKVFNPSPPPSSACLLLYTVKINTRVYIVKSVYIHYTWYNILWYIPTQHYYVINSPLAYGISASEAWYPWLYPYSKNSESEYI